MNRSFASLFALLLPLTVACSGGGGGRSDAGTDASTGLGFQPTNLPGDIDFSDVGDLDFDVNKCGNTLDLNDQGTTTCDGPGIGVYDSFLVTQTDGTKIRVFVARNIRIEQGIDVTAEGTQPIALVALDSIEILGTLDGSNGRAGGFTQPNGVDQDGRGLGGGKYDGAVTHKAGGGAYCGAGGASGDGSAAGGLAYGNAMIAPLVGGSTGGGPYPGAGGGAIQLVAGRSIHVGAAGWMSVGGGGGESGSLGGGGGAGGALLLEAPSVVIDGALAANGGGGGAGGGSNYGEDAQHDAIAARGGLGAGGDGSGGDGASAAVTTGANGTAGDVDLLTHGHGGGGAGRVRINTTSGVATLAGVLSPSVGTCATQGTLMPL